MNRREKIKKMTKTNASIVAQAVALVAQKVARQRQRRRHSNSRLGRRLATN